MSRLVRYVGDRNPSVSQTISIDGSEFDLNSPGSTVQFKARFVGESTLKVNAAATIVQVGTGIGVTDLGVVRYDWAALDVDTAGDLVIWWEVTTGGKVQAVHEAIIEIREHAPASSRGICSRADVMRLVPGYSDDPDTDGVLEEIIKAESRSAHQLYGREFVSIASATTRTFDLDEWSVRERRVRVGDMTTVTTVVIKDVNGVTLETVAAADRVSLGSDGNRTREEWEPITELWFPPTTAAASSLAEGNVVVVTGVWGFPELPADLRMAVAKLVLVRYLADAANAGTALADAANEQGFDAGIAFVSAREVLRSYQESRFA